MFKMEETTSDDGDITGIIFMRPDGMFEGRLYRKQMRNEVPEERASPDGEFELCAVTGTLIHARILLHEELGCNRNGCNVCNLV